LGKVFTGDDLAVSDAGHLGVVGTRAADGLVRVRSINPATGVRSNYYYGTAFSGTDVEMVGGLDPTVLGTRALDGLVRVRVTDATTRLPLANYYFGKAYSGLDVEEAISGLVAVLGQAADGSIRVRIQDPGGGQHTISY
jgi:hypothetical protein